MLTEKQIEKYQHDQPFHAVVKTLTKLVEDDEMTLGDLYDALVVVEHKLHENAAQAAPQLLCPLHGKPGCACG